MPVVTEFNPDLVIVACGFDACDGDPLGDLSLEPYCYEYMTRELTKLNKPIVCLLEGGYNIKSLEQGSYGVVSALLCEQFKC